MKAVVLLTVLALAGCSAPAPATPEPPLLESYRACKGVFPNGQEWTCESSARKVHVEASIPDDWQEVGWTQDDPYDSIEFYRSQGVPGDQVGLGDEWGVWFKLTPRGLGDYASPLPTKYGGVMWVQDGPFFAWQSESPQGFVRAPTEFPAPLLDQAEVFYVIYVPVVRGNMTELSLAQVEPLWFKGSNVHQPPGFQNVIKIQTMSDTFYLYDGPRVFSAGHSLAFSDQGKSVSINIYQLRSGQALTR